MTSLSNSNAAGRERLEGEVVSIGRVIRLDDLNDLNDERADAATEALALYMEHKGQTRKLNETKWKSLLATLEDIHEQSKPLSEKMSITLAMREGSGEAINVQIAGQQAKEISELVDAGDRIVGEGVRSEEGFLLHVYDVYKRAAGSGGRITAAVEPVDKQDEDAETPELTGGEEGATAELDDEEKDASHEEV
jgi:hypothetical protein